MPENKAAHTMITKRGSCLREMYNTAMYENSKQVDVYDLSSFMLIS